MQELIQTFCENGKQLSSEMFGPLHVKVQVVLGQDTVLSQCLSPSRCIIGLARL